MTMPDDEALEAGARAVKLVASDWRKLTLLAVAFSALTMVAGYRVVAAMVESKVAQVDSNADTLRDHDRRITTLETDAKSAAAASKSVADQIAETNRELKAATAEMNRLRGTIEAMQIYGSNRAGP